MHGLHGGAQDFAGSQFSQDGSAILSAGGNEIGGAGFGEAAEAQLLVFSGGRRHASTAANSRRGDKRQPYRKLRNKKGAPLRVRLAKLIDRVIARSGSVVARLLAGLGVLQFLVVLAGFLGGLFEFAD